MTTLTRYASMHENSAGSPRRALPLRSFGSPPRAISFREMFRRAAPLVLLCALAFVVGVRHADAAKLFLFPDPLELSPGGTAILEIHLDTEGESVNAAQVVISFPQGALDVREVLTGGSVLPIAPEAPFLGSGTVKVVGGAPAGFSGSGVVARLLFEATGGGELERATVRFLEGTSVLLNDGKATPARLSTRDAEIAFVPPGAIAIISPSHPSQDRWYQNRTAIFHWEVSGGAAYSYQLSRDPNVVPDETPDTPVGDIKFENLEDGIYYFSLREIAPTPEDGRGTPRVSRYRIMVDTTPPEPFEVSVTKQRSVYEGDLWYAAFFPRDALSGIARVEVAEVVGNEEPQWYEAASPYVLRFQDRRAKLFVRAVDFAENASVVEVPPARAVVRSIGLFISFLALALVIVLVQWRRRRRERAMIGNAG